MDRIIVLGGNFASVTVALETHRRLERTGHDRRFTAISASERFLCNPSMIRVDLARRRVEE